MVRVTGVKHPGKTVSVLVRGSNRLMLEEAERSVHDSLCVVRCLVKQKCVVHPAWARLPAIADCLCCRYMIGGGGAPETEIALRLSKYADTISGMESYCIRAFADALEIVPYTLAENAGLHPIQIVTELKRQHALGNVNAGINVRRVCHIPALRSVSYCSLYSVSGRDNRYG